MTTNGAPTGTCNAKGHPPTCRCGFGGLGSVSEADLADLGLIEVSDFTADSPAPAAAAETAPVTALVDFRVGQAHESGGTPVFDVVAANGVPFRVRVVAPGGAYGATGSLTNDSGRPLVEFYDARYAHSPHGQFVSRYHADTLTSGRDDAGIDLYGGEPNWKVDAAAMSQVRGWLRSASGQAAASGRATHLDVPGIGRMPRTDIYRGATTLADLDHWHALTSSPESVSWDGERDPDDAQRDLAMLGAEYRARRAELEQAARAEPTAAEITRAAQEWKRDNPRHLIAHGANNEAVMARAKQIAVARADARDAEAPQWPGDLGPERSASAHAFVDAGAGRSTSALAEHLWHQANGQR